MAQIILNQFDYTRNSYFRIVLQTRPIQNSLTIQYIQHFEKSSEFHHADILPLKNTNKWLLVSNWHNFEIPHEEKTLFVSIWVALKSINSVCGHGDSTDFRIGFITSVVKLHFSITIMIHKTVVTLFIVHVLLCSGECSYPFK